MTLAGMPEKIILACIRNNAVADPSSGSLLWNIKQAGILHRFFSVPLAGTFHSVSFCFCAEN